MDANHFIVQLQANLSRLVLDERTVYARFDDGLVPGPGHGSVFVTFVNLPETRVKEKRGGGAENENNHMSFVVHGFGERPDDHADKVQVKQLVNGVYGPGSPSRENRAPNLRSRTASPDKIATHLANYLNEVAENFEPKYTHD